MVSNRVSLHGLLYVVHGQSHTNFIQDLEIQIFQSLRNYQNREIEKLAAV